jgi:hypothetical protein
MPLPTTLKLFIDAKAGLAYPTYSSTSPISNPSFFLGDLAKLKIFFIEQTGLGTYPRQEVPGLGSPGIKVALGEIDASPTSGHFHLIFGGETSFAFDYNVTASFMETKLNQLSSISAAGGVTVAKVGDNYSIKFNSFGSRGAFGADGTALIPLSTVGIDVLQEGDGSHPEIVLVHLQQNVAALATSFSASPASTITSSVLSAWDGSRASYRIAISPDPKGGTFTLGFDALTGTDVSTSSIAVGSTALEVENALGINALAGKVSVQQVGAFIYDVTVTAQPDTAGLTANGAGLISFAGFEGDLDINTANAISYLDGAESIETTLEVEISDGTAHQTVLQIPCTLRSSVVDETTVNAVTLDPVLTQATADGRYLQQSNNLADLTSVSTARTNLDVYSKAEADAAIISGAGAVGLPTSGGAMDANAIITLSNASYDSEVGGWGFGVELTSDTAQQAYIEFNQVTVANGSGATSITPSGITFPDSTSQTTAAVNFNGGTVSSSVSVSASGSTTTIASTGITFPDSTVQTTAPVVGANVADCLAHTIFNVYWTGSAWQMTFQPINAHIANLVAGGNLQIFSQSGVDTVTGISTSSQINYTTSIAGNTDYLYLRMVIMGVTITSTQPINYP